MKGYVSILLSRSGIILLAGLTLMFVHHHWAHFIGFLLIFSAYDVFGYRDVGKFDVMPSQVNVGLESYRVMQVMYQVLFMCYIFVIDGGPTTIACAIAWYFLTCDVIYYFLVNKALIPFTWFLPSPVNFVYNVIFRQPTPVWAVSLSALFGLATGLFITLAER
jgi:hypothetical protein